MMVSYLNHWIFQYIIYIYFHTFRVWVTSSFWLSQFLAPRRWEHASDHGRGRIAQRGIWRRGAAFVVRGPGGRSEETKETSQWWVWEKIWLQCCRRLLGDVSFREVFPTYQSSYLPTYLPTYLSIYISISLSYLFVYLSIYLSVYLSIYLSVTIYFFIHFSISLSISPNLCISIFLSLSLSLSFSISLPICLAVYLPISLSLSLSIFISVSLSINLVIYQSVYLKGNNYARLPSKVESWAHSWQPRTNVRFFSPISLKYCPMPRKSEARSYEVLHLSRKII
jgi:hypothetical protein